VPCWAALPTVQTVTSEVERLEYNTLSVIRPGKRRDNLRLSGVSGCRRVIPASWQLTISRDGGRMEDIGHSSGYALAITRNGS
jgi:hypothetical protein